MADFINKIFVPPCCDGLGSMAMLLTIFAVAIILTIMIAGIVAIVCKVTGRDFDPDNEWKTCLCVMLDLLAGCIAIATPICVKQRDPDYQQKYFLSRYNSLKSEIKDIEEMYPNFVEVTDEETLR